MTQISVRVDGASYTDEVEPRTLLVHYLREQLGKVGTVVGCDTSNCGACTVHLDGEAVKSCTVLAVQADGGEVTTIEGMEGPEVAAVQAAWTAIDVPQCGWCQSGQVMSATALLQQIPQPSDEDIDNAMAGNICRCATYVRIRQAIHDAARTLEG